MTTSSLYPTLTIICKVPQSSSEFQTQIQPKVFQCLKFDIEHYFEHGEIINYTLDGVSIHPVTTKIQASFLNSVGKTWWFGDFKTVSEINGCDRRKLRMDKHCSYSIIVNWLTEWKEVNQRHICFKRTKRWMAFRDRQAKPSIMSREGCDFCLFAR